jgi:hypothetical protein
MTATAHSLEGMLPDAFGSSAPIGTSPMEIQGLFNSMNLLAGSNATYDSTVALETGLTPGIDRTLG